MDDKTRKRQQSLDAHRKHPQLCFSVTPSVASKLQSIAESEFGGGRGSLQSLLREMADVYLKLREAHPKTYKRLRKQFDVSISMGRPKLSENESDK